MLTPLSPDECAKLFQPLEPEKRIALAVSGGPDSTALLALAARWVCSNGNFPELLALTVDHGLRPESRQEAAQVADWAARLGVPHQTLRWEGPKPKSNL
ncbi:MAG: hypothetical protein K8F25_00175, partial [Fimbriimonadaceae bacterium]|nr:hypothetical protein [Alphaproteobacteria bacterium]